jgi:hypothetical protein
MVRLVTAPYRDNADSCGLMMLTSEVRLSFSPPTYHDISLMIVITGVATLPIGTPTHDASQPLTLYRVYNESAKELGPYWTSTLPASSAEAVRSLALDPVWGNTADNWVAIEVPSGISYFEGTAAEQPFQPGSGGGSQIFFKSSVDPSWVTGGGSLP